MSLDNVELKDDIEQSVTPDSRVSCNQIKTRESSFRSFSDRWRKFRIQRLNERLDAMKNNLVTDSFMTGSNSKLTPSAEKDLEQKTAAIARLEEKIMILSRDDVPSSYVKHRAIKLKSNMIKNMTYNCGKAYSVGMRNYDKVFGPEDPSTMEELGAVSQPINVEEIAHNNGEVLANEVNDAMKPPVEEKPISKEEVEQVLDDAFAKVDPVVPENPISREDVNQVLEEELGNVVIPEAEKQPEVVITPPAPEPTVVTVSPEEVARAVNDNPVVGYNDLKDAVDEALAGVKVEADKPSDHYDPYDVSTYENRNFDYKPMTDEEIAKAQQNIEYDKYEKVYADEWKDAKEGNYVAEEPVIQNIIRDDVVITPERETPVSEPVIEEQPVVEEKPVIEEPVEEFTMADDKEELHFDYTDATQEDVVRATSVEGSRMGLEALRERVMRLKEENRQSKEDLEAARNAQTDEARRAMEVRNAARAKKQKFDEAVKRFSEYCDSLEEATKVNRSSAAISRNDIECNKRFIDMKMAEMDEYDGQMREIDSIMADEEEIKRR